MKKMFITDLDGTLFTDDKRINQADLEAFEYLGEIGVTRVFATGRSLYSFQRAVEKIGFSKFCEDIPVDYLIFSTGAGIIKYNNEQYKNLDESIDVETKAIIIKQYSLESEDVSHIADYFDSLKLDYMIHRPVPDSHYCIYRKQSQSVNLDFNFRIELYKDFISKIDHSEPIRGFGEAAELLTIIPDDFFFENEDKRMVIQNGDNIASMIQKALPQFSVVRATSPLDGKSVWIEVFNKNVSKSQAVEWLAGELGILQDDVAAIGNDYNDLDMLEWAGTSFLVNNAPKELKYMLKDKKNLIEAGSNNECGVAEAVKHFI